MLQIGFTGRHNVLFHEDEESFLGNASHRGHRYPIVNLEQTIPCTFSDVGARRHNILHRLGGGQCTVKLIVAVSISSDSSEATARGGGFALPSAAGTDDLPWQAPLIPAGPLFNWELCADSQTNRHSSSSRHRDS